MGLQDSVIGALVGSQSRSGQGDSLQAVIAALAQAQSLGLSQGDAVNELWSLLPQVVDRLTPNGELPDAAGLDDLGGLLERFSRP
jgi:uncharacterized protein YidB (DUF937 family)